MRLVSVLGFVTMIGIAWLSSTDRSRFPLRTVLWGVGLQLSLGALLLRTKFGGAFFVEASGSWPRSATPGSHPHIMEGELLRPRHGNGIRRC